MIYGINPAMKIYAALETIRAELAKASVDSPISVELSVALHQQADGSIECECLHPRSPRTDQVHKIRIDIPTDYPNSPRGSLEEKEEHQQNQESARQGSSLPDHIKQQIDAAEPEVKSLEYLRSQDPNYLNAQASKDLRL